MEEQKLTGTYMNEYVGYPFKITKYVEDKQRGR